MPATYDVDLMNAETQVPTEPEVARGDGATPAETPHVPAEPNGTDENVADSKPAPGYPFSVLGVLRTAVRVTKRNFVPFFVLACVLQIPSIVVKLGAGGTVWPVLAVQTVTSALTTAVVSYGVIMDLHGSRPSARTCIATGLSQLGRVLGVTLVSTLAIIGAMLLLVVPGIVVALMLYVVTPVTVFEGLGIRASMKRSRELTHGRKGDLFLLMALAGCVGVAIELFAHYELGPDAAYAWRAFGGAFSSMFFAVTAAVAYVELRKLREGTQVPELATAFARFRK